MSFIPLILAFPFSISDCLTTIAYFYSFFLFSLLFTFLVLFFLLPFRISYLISFYFSICCPPSLPSVSSFLALSLLCCRFLSSRCLGLSLSFIFLSPSLPSVSSSLESRIFYSHHAGGSFLYTFLLSLVLSFLLPSLVCFPVRFLFSIFVLDLSSLFSFLYCLLYLLFCPLSSSFYCSASRVLLLLFSRCIFLFLSLLYLFTYLLFSVPSPSLASLPLMSISFLSIASPAPLSRIVSRILFSRVYTTSLVFFSSFVFRYLTLPLFFVSIADSQFSFLSFSFYFLLSFLLNYLSGFTSFVLFRITFTCYFSYFFVCSFFFLTFFCRPLFCRLFLLYFTYCISAFFVPFSCVLLLLPSCGALPLTCPLSVVFLSRFFILFQTSFLFTSLVLLSLYLSCSLPFVFSLLSFLLRLSSLSPSFLLVSSPCASFFFATICFLLHLF